MRYGSVYVATNKHTGEQYVGQTRQSVQKRWDAHWRTAVCHKARKAKFQLALAEHGKNAFSVEEVFVAFDSTALNSAEIQLIAELAPAYNSSRGGKGLRPIIVSDAVRAKRSEAAKARWANPAWREKTAESIRVASQTPAAVFRGKALRVYKGVEKRWAGHIKKPRPIYNKSETIKASWADPVVRQKRIDGLKIACANPENQRKRIAASTGRRIPREVVEKSARAKWKPLYCPELLI